jgi:hypothetical protein
MKIDFRKIELTDLEGNKSTVDVSKAFGNAIYQNTGDLGEFNLAQDSKGIYNRLLLNIL